MILLSFSPFRYILRSITLLGQFIVDQTKFTPLFSGRDSVQTNVELGAVVGVSVLGVRVELSKLISWGVGWTLKSVSSLKSISLGLAFASVSGFWPVADSAVLVKPESG